MMEVLNDRSERLFLRKMLLSAVFSMIVALGVGSALAQDGLAVYISTEKDVYRVGQPVTVTYTVVNDSGQDITLERTSCTPVFKLAAYDLDDQQIWNSENCPICCCTCCRCPIQLIRRNIPQGETVFENDVTWRQLQITGRERCGCVTQQVDPGYYYLIGAVGDVMSDPILIEIR